MGDDSWRTPAFRQSIVAKIDEAIKTSGTPTSKNSVEMENHVFIKAKSKEEYLGLVARLILHVREMNSKKGGNMNGQGGGQVVQGGGGPGMPDPINALQTLATQGTRNTQMMNTGPPVPTNMNPVVNNSMNTASNLLQTLNNRPGGGGGGGIPNIPMQGPGMIQNKMGMNQMGQQMIQMHQKPLMMNPGFQGPRTVTPNQYLRQSPTPSSPLNPGLQGPMIPSPALVPSPSSLMQQRSVGMAPSPGSGSSLNTPGGVTSSPLEDQAYRDKVRQLSKYIEPLRKMIARMGNEGEPAEKTSKMKNLLEILSNPTKRMPLETILKCQVVLERMDLKRNEVGSNLPTIKENNNPLLEVINNSIQSPVFNHTLQRTFGPSTGALNGPEIKGLPAPLKRKRMDEGVSDIPDVLQGEIARLDSRFKVSLDPIQLAGSGSGGGSRMVQLICWLDDRHLPCVPPVLVSVPEAYPNDPPVCHMADGEYTATPFLTAVQTILLARVTKLPKRFSVSEMLHTWEMSVRQASQQQRTTISPATILLGM